MFVQYLKDNILVIDIYDASTQVHYGYARISMNKLLRQGQPTRVLAQELDIHEPN